jgi:hypothetical protein
MSTELPAGLNASKSCVSVAADVGFGVATVGASLQEELSVDDETGSPFLPLPSVGIFMKDLLTFGFF